jgi:alpha-1,3/alpha-1,6-mannosyltransferase
MQLLCTDRRSMLKSLYRLGIDMLEEYTTGLASVIAVNSMFTASVVKNTFKNMTQLASLSVSTYIRTYFY